MIKIIGDSSETIIYTIFWFLWMFCSYTLCILTPPMKILLLILIAFCLLVYTWKYRKPCIENVDDQEKPLDGTS